MWTAEWNKHGTCAAATPLEYFIVSNEIARQLPAFVDATCTAKLAVPLPRGQDPICTFCLDVKGGGLAADGTAIPLTLELVEYNMCAVQAAAAGKLVEENTVAVEKLESRRERHTTAAGKLEGMKAGLGKMAAENPGRAAVAKLVSDAETRLKTYHDELQESILADATLTKARGGNLAASSPIMTAYVAAIAAGKAPALAKRPLADGTDPKPVFVEQALHADAEAEAEAAVNADAEVDVNAEAETEAEADAEVEAAIQDEMFLEQE